MTDTRATRANRRAADRAHTEPGTAATRGRRGRPRTTERANTGPHVEEPESEEHRGSDHRGDRDACHIPNFETKKNLVLPDPKIQNQPKLLKCFTDDCISFPLLCLNCVDLEVMWILW